MLRNNTLNMKKIILYIFIVSIIISCKGKKEISETDDLSKVEIIPTSYTVLNDTSIFGYCRDFTLYKDYLIVLSCMDEKFLHIYDKNTGKHLKSSLPRGRGPGEIIRSFYLTTNLKTGKVSWFETSDDKYISINIESLVNNDHYTKYMDNSYPNFNTVKIIEGNDLIICLGEVSNGKKTRLGLANSDSVVFRSDYLPDLPELKLENIQYSLQFTVRWHFSPFNNKLVCAHTNGTVLEIFDVDKTSIKISSLKVFEKPLYIMNEENIPENVKDKSIIGFTGVYVTSENIYASYMGSTDYRNKVEKIIEFDLDGNPLRILRFDNISIDKICVDELGDRNRIYMMVQEEGKDNFIVYADI